MGRIINFFKVIAFLVDFGRKNRHKLQYHYDKTKFFGGNYFVDSTLGKYSYISFYSIVSYTTIGNYSSIGPNCVIGYGDHLTDLFTTSPAIYYNSEIFSEDMIKKTREKNYKQVSIGNDVWIGANCFVKNGVKIGNGAIIGAHSTVLKDVPEYAVVVGTPAKVIRYRYDEKIIVALSKLNWWNYEPNEAVRIISESGLFNI